MQALSETSSLKLLWRKARVGIPSGISVDLPQVIKVFRSHEDFLGVNLPKEDDMLVELRKIRELLTPAAAPPQEKGLWQEFKGFIKSYKVMGLAVAFIMGIYLGGLVQALVADLIMPIIGLALPGLENLATIEVAVGSQSFLVGHFLVAVITFIIVACVIFLLVKISKRWGID